jgi:hypothetical protein
MRTIKDAIFSFISWIERIAKTAHIISPAALRLNLTLSSRRQRPGKSMKRLAWAFCSSLSVT